VVTFAGLLKNFTELTLVTLAWETAQLLYLYVCLYLCLCGKWLSSCIY